MDIKHDEISHSLSLTRPVTKADKAPESGLRLQWRWRLSLPSLLLLAAAPKQIQEWNSVKKMRNCDGFGGEKKRTCVLCVLCVWVVLGQLSLSLGQSVSQTVVTLTRAR